ncbi:universal stress protein [Brachybacterium sp. YJGR34]|uniref:universal stress protein n=1 Tax=Brachybacterium sp. YJGR34 TaxID=2059911 RepID=UPI000E0A3F72|nr:universal stress protein [Brachybacterium sp. YJGR34]
MSTVLLAYVPGPTSDAALAYAVEEARRRGASLLVLASERRHDPRAPRGDVDPRPLDARLAETGLEVDLRTVPRRDDPADDILEAIEAEDVDVAVLGIRRRTPIGKILLGSTSQRVVMESPVPVVLVKPEDFAAPPRVRPGAD